MGLRAPPRSPLTELFAWLVIAVVRVSGPVTPTSWFRTPAENAAVGGVPNSLHLLGLAIDVVGDPGVLGRVASIWRAIGLQAKVESDHLHLELDAG